MKRTSTISVFLILLFAVSVQVQAQTSKPGPELKKLAFLAGTWTMDGDLKPGPMGPAAK